MAGPYVHLALLIGLDGSVSVQSVSNEVPAQLGFTPEDFLTSKVSFNHLVHPGDSDIAASLLSLQINAPSCEFLIRLRHADGRFRIFRGSFSKQAAPSPGCVTVHLELADVRHIADPGDAVMLSSFKTLIAQTNDYIYIKNRNHVFLAASEQLPKFTETIEDCAELAGKTDYDIHPEAVANIGYGLEERAFAEGRRVNLIQQLTDRDGKQYWIDNRKYPINGPDGGVIGIFGVAPDITRNIENERRVRESETLLHFFIEHAPAALAMFDRDMRYLAVSRRWLEMYLLTEAQVIGRIHYDVFPDLPESWKSAHKRALAGQSVRAEEDLFERADGSRQWLHWELIPWREVSGSVGGVIIFVEDITERTANAERLRLAASVFTHAREGITITDAGGTILEVNDAFTRITGYSRGEVLGHNPRILKSGLQGHEFYENMWRLLRNEGQWSGEVWNRAKSGNIYAEHLSINAVRDSSGKVMQYVAHFSDITALKEHQLELEHMTYYDGLTGLPNRTLLADRLRQAMSQAHRRGQQIAVAYLDIDGFKGINTQYGHGAGDTLLITLSARFKTALREGDTLARLGGDEFMAVMLDLDNSEAGEVILKGLLDAASDPIKIDGQQMKVSASIDVTFYPQDEELDEDGLIRQADQAMYQAKLDGRNCYRRFDPSQDLTIRGRHEGIEQIRRGLAAREFVSYYQPKVNMRTGKVIGAESLIRWQHPDRGLMAPAAFLPMVEDHPLAIEIGEWVIDTALTQMEIWHDQGLDIPVSVNVGAMQLQQPDFVDRLCALLAAHPRISPAQLEIEVIETSALRDVLQASQVLNACHNIGVTVALDDFGTGYSSLAYLKRLPANVLKIDQSFVREMFDDPENLTILEGVLGLASAFRLNVIAEGVETPDHGLVLLQLGCEFAQGFGIARPMPPDEFPRWAAGWHSDPRWANVRPMNSSNRHVLYAGVEHRAWIAAFESFLQGKRNAPPPLDSHQCHFGVWLDKEGRESIGLTPTLESLQRLHRQIHEFASHIFSALAHDRTAALAELPALHDLRDQLLHELEAYGNQEGWRPAR
jgi:diguanylate cyclase (GGDEF)-like protein/PAS domain S-box-containing protein